jgi:hypothetical protein
VDSWGGKAQQPPVVAILVFCWSTWWWNLMMQTFGSTLNSRNGPELAHVLPSCVALAGEGLLVISPAYLLHLECFRCGAWVCSFSRPCLAVCLL